MKKKENARPSNTRAGDQRTSMPHGQSRKRVSARSGEAGGAGPSRSKTNDAVYRRLVETMGEGAATVGAGGLVLYCNPRLGAMLGLPVAKIVGTPLLDRIEPEKKRAVAALIRACRRKSGRVEARLVTADGSFLPAQISCGPLDRAAGLACVLFTDLTEVTLFQGELEQANANLEKQVAARTEQLEKSNRENRENYLKFLGLFENIREPVAVFEAVRNARGEIEDAVLREGNPGLAREAGVRRASSLKGKSAAEIYGAQRAAEKLAALREALARGGSLTVEARDERRGRDYLRTFVPLDADRFLVTGADVTALKEAERRAVRSEERLAGIFQASPAGLFVSRRADGFLFEVNRAFLDILGFGETDVIGRTSRQLDLWLASEDRPRLLRAVDESGWLEGYELRLRRKDGRVIEARVSLVPIEFGGESCFLGVVTDVTEGKRAEAALLAAQSELERRVTERTEELNGAVDLLTRERKRLHDVLDLLPVYVILLAPDYRVPFANRYFVERFGESGGKRCYEYLFNRDAPCETCETYEVLETGKPKTWDWVGPDGRNYSIFDYPYSDTDGTPLILEMGIDVSDRLRAEAELARHRDRLEELVAERTGQLERANTRLLKEIEERRRADDRLRFQAGILEAVSDAVIGTDTALNIVYWNKGAERLYGWKAEEVMGLKSADVLRSRISNEERIVYREALALGETIDNVFEQATKDGQWLVVEGYTMPVRNADGVVTGYAVVNHDITGKRRAEKEIKDLSRFPGENPNPVLRLTPDGLVLYCNEAGEEIARTWGAGPDRSLPEPWRGVAADAFARSVNASAEITCGERVFSFIIVPVADRGYINMYGKEESERKRAEADVKRYIAELRTANEELSRFNRAMVGRELRMIELKKEVNLLSMLAGESPRYSVLADGEKSKDRSSPPPGPRPRSTPDAPAQPPRGAAGNAESTEEPV